MHAPIDSNALATLFSEARTHSAWLDKALPDALLEQLYDHVRLGPTAVNSCPARFVFVRSAEGKQKLAPCLSKGNLDKTLAAPVTVIVAYDEDFPETLPELFPFADARSWYAGQPALITENALRNSSLQAGYLILAARALGARLRTDVRLRRQGIERGLLRRHHLEIQSVDQPRLRRCQQAARPSATPALRPRLRPRLMENRPCNWLNAKPPVNSALQ